MDALCLKFTAECSVAETAPSMLRPDKPVLNRVKIGEGFGRP